MGENSQDAKLNELGLLITTARQYEGKFPGLRPFRVKLEKAYMDALSARSTRDGLSAATQKATRRLKEALTTTEEAGMRLRSYARGALGPRNEQLTCFGVAPLKRRRPPRPDELDAAPAKAQEGAA